MVIGAYIVFGIKNQEKLHTTAYITYGGENGKIKFKGCFKFYSLFCSIRQKKIAPKGAINSLYIWDYYFVNAINDSLVLKLTNSKSLTASVLYEAFALIALVKLIIAASLFAALAAAIAFR